MTEGINDIHLHIIRISPRNECCTTCTSTPKQPNATQTFARSCFMLFPLMVTDRTLNRYTDEFISQWHDEGLRGHTFYSILLTQYAMQRIKYNIYALYVNSGSSHNSPWSSLSKTKQMRRSDSPEAVTLQPLGNQWAHCTNQARDRTPNQQLPTRQLPPNACNVDMIFKCCPFAPEPSSWWEQKRFTLHIVIRQTRALSKVHNVTLSDRSGLCIYAYFCDLCSQRTTTTITFCKRTVSVRTTATSTNANVISASRSIAKGGKAMLPGCSATAREKRIWLQIVWAPRA